MATTLTKAEKSQIRAFMREKGWGSVMRFVGMKIDQWKEQPITGQSAYEELKALHTRDGKVSGVLELFDEMERTVTE